MNAERRAKIEEITTRLQAIHVELEEIQAEELEYFENMPENLQGGEKGAKAEGDAEVLQDAADSIQGSIDDLQSVCS